MGTQKPPEFEKFYILGLSAVGIDTPNDGDLQNFKVSKDESSQAGDETPRDSRRGQSKGEVTPHDGVRGTGRRMSRKHRVAAL